ncbi:MAG: 4'-phosphopantetheinyl transferase superfamily protein [Christensenellales bacterium]
MGNRRRSAWHGAEREAHFSPAFTENERAYLQGRGRAGQSAAAMFAAKEAVAKALGTGFAQGVMPWQIEVTHEQSGKPGVLLTARRERNSSRLADDRFGCRVA